MEFRCNPLGALFIGKNAKNALGIYAASFLLPSLAIILLLGTSAWKIWIFFPAFFVLATILTLFSVIYMPRWISIDGKQLIWKEKLNVRHDKIDHYVIVFWWDHSCIATITVDKLHEIEFLQTPIERLFNIGRIRFLGEIRSMEAREPVIKPSIPFYYGGICKFDQFQAHLRNELSDSAFKKDGEMNENSL